MHLVLCGLHWKLFEFGFDAAVPHAHPGQRWSDVSSATCGKNNKREGILYKESCTGSYMSKPQHSKQTQDKKSKIGGI